MAFDANTSRCHGSSVVGMADQPPASPITATVIRYFALVPASERPANRALDEPQRTRYCCCRACSREREGERAKRPSSTDERPIAANDEAPRHQKPDEASLPLELHWDPDTVSDDGEAAAARCRNRLLMRQLKALHEHCFPVAYDERFFTELQGLGPARANGHYTVLIALRMSSAASGRSGDVGFDEGVVRFRPYFAPREDGGMTRHVLGADRVTGAAGYGPTDAWCRRAHPTTRPPLRHTLVNADDDDDFEPSPWQSARDARCQMMGVVTVRVSPLPQRLLRSLSRVKVEHHHLGPQRGLGHRYQAYIPTLGVREEARRDGVARALLDSVLALTLPPAAANVARGETAPTVRACERVWLHCLAGNVPAINMYVRKGFRVVDFRPAFYHIAGRVYDCDILVLLAGDVCAPKDVLTKDVLTKDVAAVLTDASTFDDDSDGDDGDDNSPMAVDGAGGDAAEPPWMVALPYAVGFAVTVAVSLWVAVAGPAVVGPRVSMAGGR